MKAKIHKDRVTVDYKQGVAERCYTAPGKGGTGGVLAELECGHLGPKPQKVNGKLTRSTCCRWCTNEWKAGKLKIEESGGRPREADAAMAEIVTILRGLSNRLTSLEDVVTKPKPLPNGTAHFQLPAPQLEAE